MEVLPGRFARGAVVEIDPPRRFVLTWGWEPGSGSPVEPGESTVAFDLTPTPQGTLLRLTHRDLASAEARESHAHGWEHYLGRLGRLAAGADPGVDPWIDERGR